MQYKYIYELYYIKYFRRHSLKILLILLPAHYFSYFYQTSLFIGPEIYSFLYKRGRKITPANIDQTFIS